MEAHGVTLALVDAYAVAQLAIGHPLVDDLVAKPNQSQRQNTRQKDMDVPKVRLDLRRQPGKEPMQRWLKVKSQNPQ